jgi:general secretion pathway protein K
MMSETRYRFRQGGVALLAALILMLAVVLSLTTIFYRHQIDIGRHASMLHGDQAFLLAMSVESWAGQQLSTGQDAIETDHLQENWALAIPALPIEGGQVMGCLVDLQSRLNLNSFGRYDSERWAEEMSEDGNGLVKTWLALLSFAGLPHGEEYAAGIIDWVDADSAPINQSGAEQASYGAQRYTYWVPNADITDVEELSVVRNYTLDSVLALNPWISAVPGATAINVNTADIALLRALGAVYADSFANVVLQSRPFYSLASFHEQVANGLGLPLERVRTLWPEDLVSVRSDYFELELQVSLGQVQVETTSLFSRYGREAPVVIRRTIRQIPALLPADRIEAQQQFCQHTIPGS